jgi:hypothetical protein
MGGMLHAIDRSGALWQAPAEPAVAGWRLAPIAPLESRCTALSHLSGILVGTTETGRLVRTSADHISEGAEWHDIGEAPVAVGLASVEWMLFAADEASRLLRIDAWVLGGTPSAG